MDVLPVVVVVVGGVRVCASFSLLSLEREGMNRYIGLWVMGD